MITVLGKLEDTQPFVDRVGFNVLARDDLWTRELQSNWLKHAVKNGSQFLIVSPLNVTGQFREEVKELLEMLLEVDP